MILTEYRAIFLPDVLDEDADGLDHLNLCLIGTILVDNCDEVSQNLLLQEKANHERLSLVTLLEELTTY